MPTLTPRASSTPSDLERRVEAGDEQAGGGHDLFARRPRPGRTTANCSLPRRPSVADSGRRPRDPAAGLDRAGRRRCWWPKASTTWLNESRSITINPTRPRSAYAAWSATSSASLRRRVVGQAGQRVVERLVGAFRRLQLENHEQQAVLDGHGRLIGQVSEQPRVVVPEVGRRLAPGLRDHERTEHRPVGARDRGRQGRHRRARPEPGRRQRPDLEPARRPVGDDGAEVAVELDQRDALLAAAAGTQREPPARIARGHGLDQQHGVVGLRRVRAPPRTEDVIWDRSIDRTTVLDELVSVSSPRRRS